MKNKNNRLFKSISIWPVVIYTLILILLPLLYILFLSFFQNDSYGGIIYHFTFENYLAIVDMTYVRIFLKSALIGLVTTILCICISYPFALILKSKSQKVQNLVTKLVMVPFLTNSLIRTYGWIVLLRKNGVINQILLKSLKIK